jgi:5-methylcytosine-specific restriction enzyme A
MSTNPRIRGDRLQAIRRLHFMQCPLCVMCEREGRVTLAEELDHILALSNGGEDVQSNRQGLCKTCHAIKSAADSGYRPKGCDAQGLPTDPRHPWSIK